MDQAISILQLQFGTDFGGLFASGYEQYVSEKSMPKFMAVGNQRFIQILNVGDHWVCVANTLTANKHKVFVYDSSYRKINNSLQLKVSSLLRGEDTPDEITYKVSNYQRQGNGSRMSGFHALAAVVSLLNSENPTFFYCSQRNRCFVVANNCLKVMQNSGPVKGCQSEDRL